MTSRQRRVQLGRLLDQAYALLVEDILKTAKDGDMAFLRLTNDWAWETMLAAVRGLEKLRR